MVWQAGHVVVKESPGNRNKSKNVSRNKLARQQVKSTSGNGLASRSGIRKRKFKEQERVRDRFREQKNSGNNKFRVTVVREWFSKQVR
jgi:hypothetical protein